MQIQQDAGLAVVEIEGKGRGVVAQRHFAAGERVELCPVLIVAAEEVEQSLLRFYVFRWGDQRAVVLSYGMIYNHSSTPNLEYRLHVAERVVEFVALTAISPGDELLHNYNGDPDDDTEIAFEDGGWSKVYTASYEREN